MPTGDFKFACETCRDTGYYGDNGPGIKGNGEYHRCDQCRVEPPALDELDTLRRQLAAANERAGRLEKALRDAIGHVAGARIGYFGDHTAHCNITVRPERLAAWVKALEVPDAM